MKKLIIILLIFNSFAEANAQVAGNILYNHSNRWSHQQAAAMRTIATGSDTRVKFNIASMFNVKADSYLAIFHITQVGPTARMADSLMNERISALRKDVMAAGIPEDHFVLDMLSMVPLYEVNVAKRLFSKTYTEIPVGFEIQKNIHIHFDKAAVLDKIITSAAINEIYDLVKVDYYVKDVEAIYDSLRFQATALIEKRMEQFARLGIELEGTWRMAGDQIGVFFPLDRYESYEAFAYTSVDASRNKSLISEMKKPKTMYYNKIPYTNYDIIINPEIIEPAVQYTYSIEINFDVVKPDKKKPEPVTVTETETKYVW
ncbi:MAG: SIMPL domain-containing protein, partial [Flavobacteriales bacterium]|nr:SIMPL domain-containing protein [Flavobacteriales bacterium]